MKAKILIDDIVGRFKAGEIGEVIKNDFPEKYDYKVRLHGIVHIDNFLESGSICAIREFYFYASEVELGKDDKITDTTG